MRRRWFKSLEERKEKMKDAGWHPRGIEDLRKRGEWKLYSTAANYRQFFTKFSSKDLKNAFQKVGIKRGDGIIITAAANHIPPPLLQQLKDNGKLIIPLGSTLRFQTLTLITKEGDDLETEFITGVRFVPMTGEALSRAQSS